VPPLFVFDAQDENGFNESSQFPGTKPRLAFQSGLFFLQKIPDPLVVGPGRIDTRQHLFVTIYQDLLVHAGDEIDGKIGVVTGVILKQAILFF